MMMMTLRGRVARFIALLLSVPALSPKSWLGLSVTALTISGLGVPLLGLSIPALLAVAALLAEAALLPISALRRALVVLALRRRESPASVTAAAAAVARAPRRAPRRARLVVVLVARPVLLLRVLVARAAAVALVRELVRLVRGHALRLLPVDEVEPLGLRELVDLRGGDPGENFLRGRARSAEIARCEVCAAG